MQLAVDTAVIAKVEFPPHSAVMEMVKLTAKPPDLGTVSISNRRIFLWQRVLYILCKQIFQGGCHSTQTL